QPLEAKKVELFRLRAEEIAGSASHDPVLSEQLAQTVDPNLERIHRPVGRPLSPQAVDRALSWDDLVRIQEQEGEQRPLLRTAERQRHAVPRYLQWPEKPEPRGPSPHVNPRRVLPAVVSES